MANTNFEPIWEEVKSIKGRMYGCTTQAEWDGYKEEFKAFLSKAKLVFQTFSTIEKFNAFKDREIEAILKIYTNVKQRWITDGKANPITPPEWIIKELPKADAYNTNMLIHQYCQLANQFLKNDSVTPEYSANVDGYKQWYVNKLFKDYVPILKLKHPDTSDEKIKSVIKNIWNQYSDRFQIDD